MKLLDKLLTKRAAAHAEYQKWNMMIETLETDPDFAGQFHADLVTKLKVAKTKFDATKTNGHPVIDRTLTAAQRAARADAARKAWAKKSPKEREQWVKTIKRARKLAAKARAAASQQVPLEGK